MKRGMPSGGHHSPTAFIFLVNSHSKKSLFLLTMGLAGRILRKAAPSARCILESSDRCPNIRTVAPPNNLVLRVPCRSPIITVCGRTYHAVCLKSRWGWLGAYEYPAENDSSGVWAQRSANSVLVRESVSGYCAAHIWQENENRKESVKYAGRK